MTGSMAERVTFMTQDGVEIVGSWSPAPGRKFALLLHMMPATKESWDPWVPKLNAAGYSTLALDQRGHGESTMGGTLDYKKFSETQQQAKRFDVEAAFAFLKGKGATEENAILAGASIGANLAIRFLAEHPGTKTAIAISPGLDYHGVTTDDAIVSLGSGQQVVLVASDDDDRDAFDSCAKLHSMNPSGTTFVRRSGLGHGTHMTEKEPALADELIRQLP